MTRSRARRSLLLPVAALGCLLAGGLRADDSPPPADSASDAMQVNHILISGNTIFDDASLREIAAPFEGRALQAEDLEDLRVKLTRRYVDAGYINSGALIEAQETTDGDLRIRIVEGRLSAVRIAGMHHYRADYLPQRIAPAQATALNVNRLQERLQLLLQDGTLQQLDARLLPGEMPGESVLDATVSEGPRFRAGVSMADDRPPSVGESGGTLSLSARNLFGVNDATQTELSLTRGYTSYALQHELPLGASEFALFLRAARDDGDVVENAVRDLDIRSRTKSFELGASRQWLRSLDRSLATSFSTYCTDTTTYLLDTPFSFTAGVEDGRSRVAGLRLATEGTLRNTDQVLAARTTLDYGIPAYGATEHTDPSLPESRFVVWNGQLQVVRRVWRQSGEWVGRASFQLASRSLLPSEKMAAGGADTVRGYAVNTLVRDRAGIASLEYRHIVAHLKVPGLSKGPADGAFALAAFYDAATASDRDERHRLIAGAGVGLRWNPAPSCSAEFYRAEPLHRLDPRGDSLQDRGIHFRVSYETGF